MSLGLEQTPTRASGRIPLPHSPPVTGLVASKRRGVALKEEKPMRFRSHPSPLLLPCSGRREPTRASRLVAVARKESAPLHLAPLVPCGETETEVSRPGSRAVSSREV